MVLFRHTRQRQTDKSTVMSNISHLIYVVADIYPSVVLKPLRAHALILFLLFPPVSVHIVASVEKAVVSETVRTAVRLCCSAVILQLGAAGGEGLVQRTAQRRSQTAARLHAIKLTDPKWIC